MRRWLVYILFLVVVFSYGLSWATEEAHETPAVAETAVHEGGEAVAPEGHEAVAEGHEAVSEHEAVHGEHAAHGVHPHVTSKQLRNLLWWTVNFIALVFILVKYGRKPMADMFRARREAIENEYRELEEKRAEAEARYQEYEKKLAKLEEEARAIMEAFIEQGKKEKERIIQEAYETAERIKQQAEFYVQQELEKARESLQREVAELSVKLAEQIIRGKITADDQRRLVQEFIERVVH